MPSRRTLKAVSYEFLIISPNYCRQRAIQFHSSIISKTSYHTPETVVASIKRRPIPKTRCTTLDHNFKEHRTPSPAKIRIPRTNNPHCAHSSPPADAISQRPTEPNASSALKSDQCRRQIFSLDLEKSPARDVTFPSEARKRGNLRGKKTASRRRIKGATNRAHRTARTGLQPYEYTCTQRGREGPNEKRISIQGEQPSSLRSRGIKI